MIKTILFDVDGVLLSEEHYFDASALSVWELLVSKNYLGLAPAQFKTDYNDAEITGIRKNVFQDDKVLELQKSRGLNANWDMIYLSFAHQLLHLLSQIKDNEARKIQNWLSHEIDRNTLLEMAETLDKYQVKLDFAQFIADFEQSTETKQGLMKHLDQLAYEKLGVETGIFQGKGTLWSLCEHVSQEWYVGDDLVFASTGRPSVQQGKKGFLANETTTCPAEEIGEMFQSLLNKGYSIGIGTGRPALETIQPFKHLNWLPFFDENHIVTDDDVAKGQKEVQNGLSLSKPNPFTYVMSLLGRNHSAMDCLKQPLPLENGQAVLIVGDSIADLLAARQMGCKFAAVLTGLSGQEARAEFEKNKADYILANVLEVKELIESIK